MQLNVSQLLQSPIGTTRDYQVNEIVDVFGDGNGYLIEGGITLMRANRNILVRGVLHTEVELTCSRCLSLFRYPLSLNFEEEFVPTIDVFSGAPLPPPEEPGSFTIDEHHVIDFIEVIRQYIVLAIPMKPLCRENCPGLCPSCGRNLNEGDCKCAKQEIAPRWAALARLLK